MGLEETAHFEIAIRRVAKYFGMGFCLLAKCLDFYVGTDQNIFSAARGSARMISLDWTVLRGTKKKQNRQLRVGLANERFRVLKTLNITIKRSPLLSTISLVTDGWTDGRRSLSSRVPFLTLWVRNPKNSFMNQSR